MSTLNLTSFSSKGGRARAGRWLRHRSKTEPCAATRVTQLSIMQSADTDCFAFPRRKVAPRGDASTSTFAFTPLPAAKRRLGPSLAGHRLGEHPPKLYWSVPPTE